MMAPDTCLLGKISEGKHAMWDAQMDIGEFAQRAATEFAERQKTAQEKHKLGLLAPEVEKLVKAAFYASLIPDEGRWPSVTLMSYRKGCEMQFHFLFPDSVFCLLPLCSVANEPGKYMLAVS